MTLTQLLNDPMVVKYFANAFPGAGSVDEAYNILRAMTDPINKGDLVLEKSGCEWRLTSSPMDFDADFHSAWLRLSDYYQPAPTCPHNLGPFKQGCRPSCDRQKPNVHNELVKEITRHAENGDWVSFGIALEGLVRGFGVEKK